MKISWRVEWLLVSQRLCFAELIVRKETNEGIYVLVSQVFPIQQHVVLWHRDGSSLNFVTSVLASHIKPELQGSKHNFTQTSSQGSFSTTLFEEDKKVRWRTFSVRELNCFFLSFTFYTSLARKTYKNRNKRSTNSASYLVAHICEQTFINISRKNINVWNLSNLILWKLRLLFR